MEWKEILKVSSIVGVITSVLLHTKLYKLHGTLFPWSDQVFFASSFILGVLASGLILSKKLKKSDWGILIGMILTLIVSYVAFTVEVFLMLLLGASLGYF